MAEEAEGGPGCVNEVLLGNVMFTTRYPPRWSGRLTSLPQSTAFLDSQNCSLQGSRKLFTAVMAAWAHGGSNASAQKRVGSAGGASMAAL